MKIRRLIFAAVPLMLLLGCGAPQSTLRPAGPAAHNLSQIGWGVYITFGATAAIMWILLLYAALRKRGTLQEHMPYDEGGGHSWILIGGLAIPFVVFTGMFVMAMERMSHFPLQEASPHPKPEILVIGHQWWWEVRYLAGPLGQQFDTANEIHIPTGRPVDIQLETADVIHSFWIPALHGKVEMIPGQPNFIRIQADQEGSFPGQCGEFCGVQHAHMRLLVVAQSPDQYTAWRHHQLQPAAEPTTPEGMHGRDVFGQATCARCHTVRGTDAQGTLAPDLTHLASRRFIAANSFPNDKAYLEAWTTHAQSLKPGALMPDLPQFNGPDLRALTEYLQELK